MEKKNEVELPFVLVDPEEMVDSLDPNPNPDPTPDPKEPKEPKEPKAPKEPKEPKEPVEPKEEPEEEPEETEETDSVISAIATRLGIELAEGEEFEESEEGLTSFVSTMADRIADQKLNQFFEEQPQLGEVFDFVMMGGKLEDYFKASSPELDYKNLDMDSEDVQKSVMRTLYRKMDFTNEEIDAALEDLEIGGVLKKQAEVAAKKLEGIQAKEKEALINAQREEQKKAQIRIQEYWEKVNSTVKSGAIKGFQIPATDQKALYEYMSKPVNKGKSQEMIDAEKEDIETRTLMAFLRMKKFDLGKFVKATATTQRTGSLRDKLATSRNKLKGSDPRGVSSGTDYDIDLKNLQNS